MILHDLLINTKSLELRIITVQLQIKTYLKILIRVPIYLGYLSISKGKLLKGYYKNVPYPKWVIKVLIETVGGWYISYLTV